MSTMNKPDTQKWGKTTAHERYEQKPRHLDQKSEEAPQDPIDKRVEPGYSNNTPDNWLRGMGKGGAEGKPSFDKSKAGK